MKKGSKYSPRMYFNQLDLALTYVPMFNVNGKHVYGHLQRMYSANSVKRNALNCYVH